MVISGGAGTLLGPVVGAALVVIVKNVVSAYVDALEFHARRDLRRHRRVHAGGARARHGAACPLGLSGGDGRKRRRPRRWGPQR